MKATCGSASSRSAAVHLLQLGASLETVRVSSNLILASGHGGPGNESTAVLLGAPNAENLLAAASAALVLGRVVSRPSDGRVTCDVGSKALSADVEAATQGASGRCRSTHTGADRD